jgi:hypothetical protein
MTTRSTIDTRSTELRRSPPPARDKGVRRPSIDHGPTKDERQAQEESKSDTVSKTNKFTNDPDDPTNPNEVREGHLRKLRR